MTFLYHHFFFVIIKNENIIINNYRHSAFFFFSLFLFFYFSVKNKQKVKQNQVTMTKKRKWREYFAKILHLFISGSCICRIETYRLKSSYKMSFKHLLMYNNDVSSILSLMSFNNFMHIYLLLQKFYTEYVAPFFSKVKYVLI